MHDGCMRATPEVAGVSAKEVARAVIGELSRQPARCSARSLLPRAQNEYASNVAGGGGVDVAWAALNRKAAYQHSWQKRLVSDLERATHVSDLRDRHRLERYLAQWPTELRPFAPKALIVSSVTMRSAWYRLIGHSSAMAAEQIGVSTRSLWRHWTSRADASARTWRGGSVPGLVEIRVVPPYCAC